MCQGVCLGSRQQVGTIPGCSISGTQPFEFLQNARKSMIAPWKAPKALKPHVGGENITRLIISFQDVILLEQGCLCLSCCTGIREHATSVLIIDLKGRSPACDRSFSMSLCLARVWPRESPEPDIELLKLSFTSSSLCKVSSIAASLDPASCRLYSSAA